MNYQSNQKNNYTRLSIIDSNKGFPIISIYRGKIDVLTVLVCNAIILQIIPINFEKILNRMLDLRNITYLSIIFISLIALGQMLQTVNKNAKIVWLLFAGYFTLEFVMYWFNMGEIKSMYSAGWMLLLIGSILYTGGTVNRLILLFKIVTICIGFSTIFGLLVVYFGDPFISIREYLIGVAYEETQMMPEYGIIKEEDISRLIGFSKSIFAFSYLLVILSISSFCLFQFSNTKKGRTLWGIVFLISILGIFSNAERSALTVIFLGLLFLLNKTIFYKRKKIISLSILIFIFLLSYFVLMPMHEEKYGLAERIRGMETVETKARIYQQIAGIETILRNPLGVHNYEDYLNIAVSYPEIREHYRNQVTAPHNHFINVGFRSGWFGLLLVIVIIVYISKSIKMFRENIKHDNQLMWIYYGVVVAFIANLVNSLFHNTGLFFAEPGGLLMLALIGAGASISSKS